MADDQASQLQAKLNNGLPSILEGFGVRHIVGLPPNTHTQRGTGRPK